jgi:hypothetical protein
MERKTVGEPLGGAAMNTAGRLPFVLQQFFTKRLVNQQQVSSHTIASYRDTFQLLLRFVHQERGRQPSQLTWEDIDASLICAFLDHCEKCRQNGARTRNLRLTAIRSFFPNNFRARRKFRIIHKQAAAFTRNDVLGFVKALGSQTAECAEPPPLVFAKKTMGVVFDHRHTMPAPVIVAMGKDHTAQRMATGLNTRVFVKLFRCA